MKISGKLPIQQPIKPPDVDSIRRRLLQTPWRGGVADVSKQAMMLQHFNQNMDGTSSFSHNSLGTKLRRYGR